ncbi:hypothetical protein BJ986_001672 [Phycicoccus badiiscoriae]|uniref:Uncharacterized protein n=1 Tax=Pedococcus badiiscoriae TaxID=642776 RepID=A0A852WLU0_9MICO|nr:hypothetical protein [Pedococcus badiiscoriae]NYG07185.1 hypothetical protein [Pedococcus badiiscoriae]
MSESTETVHGGEPGTMPLGGSSVRELLTELAALEDATRGSRDSSCPAATLQSTDLLAALAREQEIIDELHARCPEVAPSIGADEVAGPATLV